MGVRSGAERRPACFGGRWGAAGGVACAKARGAKPKPMAPAAAVFRRSRLVVGILGSF